MRGDRKRILVAEELEALYKIHSALDPEVVVAWARVNEDSALHKRFNWDDAEAAHQHRLWQARQIITEVEVEYPDGRKHQVYVSPVEQRGRGGYSMLIEVLSDSQKRERFLQQALDEYLRIGEKYRSLKELAGIRAAVARVYGGKRRKKSTAKAA